MQRISTIDTIRAGQLLERVCSRVDGRATYDPEWSDERVASTIGGTCTPVNIARVRREMIGPLIAPAGEGGGAASPTQLLRRIAALEDRIADIEQVLDPDNQILGPAVSAANHANGSDRARD